MAAPKRRSSVTRHDQFPIDDYRHPTAKRSNNPPAALAAEGRSPASPRISYDYSPRLDPTLRFDASGQADALQDLLEKATRETLTRDEVAALAEALRRHEPWLEWAGKREKLGFAVDPVALHIHERVSTQAILRAAARQDVTRDLFADPALSYAKAVKFYQHDVDWSNRLILGDSLQVMASLTHRENLAGKVQMIYLDPPYGIRFGSNWQPTTKREQVNDNAAHLSREPEMIRAYRDTWQLGVHSYLEYLRQRLVAARALLTPTGSLFLQIGDDNAHLIRSMLDEVFGSRNHIASIVVQKKGSQKGDFLPPINDHLFWYARDRDRAAYYPVLEPKAEDGEEYDWIELPSGAEQPRPEELPVDAREFVPNPLTSGGDRANQSLPFEFNGRTFNPGEGNCWKTTARPVGESQLSGMDRLAGANRLWIGKNQLRIKSYRSDLGARKLTNLWTGLGGPKDPVYVVQTNHVVIERCLLMTTKAGDLVLDPTCGSGTTAFVAEEWGRRWITIDTSRVAIAITRQRLMTKCDYPYYRLKDDAKGVAGGFVCKTVRHVTLESIAQNAALDPIFTKHDPVLDDLLLSLDDAARAVTDTLRIALLGKLAAKQKTSGKRSVTEADRRRWNLPKASERFRHWTVPFDSDSDYPTPMVAAIAAYRAAWRAKQDDVDRAVAAAAKPVDLLTEPEAIRGITRVSGPFTVEAVQPAETSLDEAAHESPIDGAPETLDETFAGDAAERAAAEPQNAEAYLDQMLRLLKMDGVRFLDNRVMKFSRLEPLGTRSQAIHAEGRWVLEGDTDADPEGRATVAIAFGPQYGPVTAKQVEQLIRATSRRGYDELVIAGFAFDGAAQAAIEEAEHPELRVHMANIRPDVNPGMAGLLKDAPAAQLFTVFGKPRSTLESVGKDEWRVVMEGVDIYDPVSNTVTPSRADKVAAWFVDSDYDGRSFCITQAFFPDKNAWSKLSAALKGIVDEETFVALSGTVSLPFPKGEHACVAVKVIDPRGNEVMRLHRLGS
ncbi:site-specific DNA-methyltransferase [Muricoccus aerilatus]|uniref:site-specific DNA-methyltransferase n=1 Tax=Muricoccus aerilatus TaxID=452982 RepID=UPI00147079E8|nr:site-specific DNA-methyltransferase [Roseomonas aerilata]